MTSLKPCPLVPLTSATDADTFIGLISALSVSGSLEKLSGCAAMVRPPQRPAFFEKAIEPVNQAIKKSKLAKGVPMVIIEFQNKLTRGLVN